MSPHKLYPQPVAVEMLWLKQQAQLFKLLSNSLPALCPPREVVAEPTYYPSFSPRDFPACAEAAQRSLELAQQAVANTGAAGPDQALAQRELAYAEAQAARFANDTAQRPERDAAQRRYAELMEATGVLSRNSPPVSLLLEQQLGARRHVAVCLAEAGHQGATAGGGQQIDNALEGPTTLM